MPYLTADQISKLVRLPERVDLYVTDGIDAARIEVLRGCACWQWALRGGNTAGPSNESSPVTLYTNNNPVNPMTLAARDHTSEDFSFPANLRVLWRDANAAAATTVNRTTFLLEMAKFVATSNGLTLIANSPYRIHVTVPEAEWYHYQHWSLSITDNGVTRHIQTEPQKALNWGETFIWESDRQGHIEASFCVDGILQAHIDIINGLLSLPECIRCRRRKPQFGQAWVNCTAQAPHLHCDRCVVQCRADIQNPRSGTRFCTLATCRSAMPNRRSARNVRHY